MAVDLRLPALRRFAIAISILNIAGHTFLGFEQSWAQVAVALGTAYGVEIFLELVDARLRGRRPAFAGGFVSLVNFLLPAHITGLAVSMLLYASDRLYPMAFAAAAAIATKWVFRAPVGNKSRHFFNPSNAGIAVTLIVFPWVGIAPPYQFTENLFGPADWVLPLIIVCTGSFLNARFTRRMPLIAGWVGMFVLQAVVRNLLTGTSVPGGLLPMTGVAFLLFTFYMVTDPGTTPNAPGRQVLFGAGVAFFYALLMAFHVVFGFFFALVCVCTLRGIGLHLLALHRRAFKSAPAAEPAPIFEPVPAILRKASL